MLKLFKFFLELGFIEIPMMCKRGTYLMHILSANCSCDDHRFKGLFGKLSHSAKTATVPVSIDLHVLPEMCLFLHY